MLAWKISARRNASAGRYGRSDAREAPRRARRLARGDQRVDAGRIDPERRLPARRPGRAPLQQEAERAQVRDELDGRSASVEGVQLRDHLRGVEVVREGV